MLDAAELFLSGHGRVLERRRFERLFRGGPGEPVVHALLAFRNDDGGFGHALEPDGRGPESQPIAVLTALKVLDECDVWDPGLVGAACDWLASIAPAEGGTPFALPGGDRYPHAPWWVAPDGLPASLAITGQMLEPLQRRGVGHPWVEQARAWMWAQAERPAGSERLGAYEAIGLACFLNTAPDRERAQAAAGRRADRLREALEPRPDGPPDEHRALDLAPRPDDVLRRIFDPARIDADLDALEAGRQDDGGWTFSWLAWSPVAAAEWRGVMTIEALKTLRANGRL
jgi:hypothetical protein